MKIVFIVNALHMQRCVKRIDEFTERGYEVEAYGFDRGVELKKKPQSCNISVIGKIDSSTSYLSRISIISSGVRSVVKATKGENALYYIFGLDNVMFFRLWSSRKYIYEESDLVHTYMRSKLMVSFFERVDKSSIRKSLLSVFTSEGFIRYHFRDKIFSNTIVIANRLPPCVRQQKKVPHRSADMNHLSIGFVGYIRFNAIYNFAKVFCSNFPEHEFHFFGTTENEYNKCLFEKLKQYSNCKFHGAFKHPDGLPDVYAQIDLVLSTYDVENDNVRYAEPNKIYEGIYYETPIIVSSGTFLAEKVKKLGIGYDIDAMNENEVVQFVKHLTKASIQEKVSNTQKIDKEFTLNINDVFFSKLESLIKQ